MKKLIIVLFFLMLPNIASAGCDDSPTDSVDFSNCRFTDGQDIARNVLLKMEIYHLTFFIKVNFDTSIVMNSSLWHLDPFLNRLLLEQDLYGSNLQGAELMKNPPSLLV